MSKRVNVWATGTHGERRLYGWLTPAEAEALKRKLEAAGWKWTEEEAA
jgi:hypothetical protein